MDKIIYIGFSVLTIATLLESCVNHDLSETAPRQYTNELLYQEVIALEGYEYYSNGDILAPASESPHGSFKLRFNDIARAALNVEGELPKGKQFPQGSIVIKEVYKESVLNMYAVMKRMNNDGNAASGWLWAEYSPDGSNLYGISLKGNGCISCHNQIPNRDLVRTFDLH